MPAWRWVLGLELVPSDTVRCVVIFEFQKSSNVNGITHLIQTSSNLREWNESSDQFSLVSTTNNGDGTEKVTYRSNESFSSLGNAVFYRLSVSSQ